jgi:hypothetical protein
MTNNTSNENEQNNIIATQSAAVAESATEVATTAGAANDTPTEAAKVATTANDTPTEAAEVATPAGAAKEGSTPIPLNFDAFHTDKNGDTRNEAAARKKQSRAVDTIVSAIVSVGTSEQQSLALHKALVHPTICEVAKSVSFGPDQACWNLQRNNVIQMIEEANKNQGRGGGVIT